MDLITENIWLIMFFAWGMPLGIFRSKFRKMVYETDDWTINVKPYFVKETKALIGLVKIDHSEFVRTRLNYSIYLVIYILLFAFYKFQ